MSKTGHEAGGDGCPCRDAPRGDARLSADRGGWRGRTTLLPRVGIVGRVGLLLFVLTLLPMAVAVLLLEKGVVTDPVSMLSVGLAVGLGLLAPVSRLGASFLVLRDLQALNEFCSEIRKGRYGVRLAVGIESDDEHELLRLTRNMNWMAHHIQAQTRKLHARLDEIDLRKRFYEEMSYRDPLTGLYNRRYLDRFLPDALRVPSRRKGLFLALVDCDCFKRINDTRGHQAGDEILATLGRVIADSVREGVDVGFRFGGDEFGVVFRDLEFADCLNACERIRGRFADGNNLGCSVSIGLRGWTPGMGAAELLRACDGVLYEAKGLGGNRVASSPSDACWAGRSLV